MEKLCSLCQTVKPTYEFGTRRKGTSINSWCKQCVKNRTLAYKHSKRGIIQSIYSNQLQSSLQRKHPEPSYSKDWLVEYMMAHTEFDKLFNVWVASGYSKAYVPSIDRLDDNLPYTPDNIQLMSWSENNIKGNHCYHDGKIGAQVDQLDLNGNFIKTFPNMAIPAKLLGCSIGEISRVCVGKRNTCHNYKWRYHDCKVQK